MICFDQAVEVNVYEFWAKPLEAIGLLFLLSWNAATSEQAQISLLEETWHGKRGSGPTAVLDEAPNKE